MSKNAANAAQTTEKTGSFRYLITNFNKEGWANADTSTPIPFDLVIVLTDTDKKIAAWWNTSNWEGLRLKKTDKVIQWKRRLYEHIS